MSPERQEVCQHIEVTLKEYFEAKLDALDKALTLAQKDFDRISKEVSEDRIRLTAIETRNVTWTRALVIIFSIAQLGEGVFLYFLFHK
jgi:CHASE3 domain sensor protein